MNDALVGRVLAVCGALVTLLAIISLGEAVLSLGSPPYTPASTLSPPLWSPEGYRDAAVTSTAPLRLDADDASRARGEARDRGPCALVGLVRQRYPVWTPPTAVGGGGDTACRAAPPAGQDLLDALAAEGWATLAREGTSFAWDGPHAVILERRGDLELRLGQDGLRVVRRP